MEEDVASCIIHFDDVSNEILRQFTAVSLSKFIHCRKIWLSLSGAQNQVAVNSLEHFTEFDEEKFSNEGTIPQRRLQYHVDCYRKFTDKTKIERAQRSLPDKGKLSEPAAKKAKVEEYQKTRGRLQRTASAGSKSTHVLPRVCLICKKEELTYTCPVTKKRTIQKLTQSQTFDAGKLRLAAEKKRDESILIHIRDRDCVAIEACYHKKCYAGYTNFLNYEQTDEKVGKIYEKSYEYFCEEFVKKRLIINKEILFMRDLLKAFIKAVHAKEGLDASNYRAHRLKARLKRTYPELTFHMPGKKNISELVFSECLTKGDIAETTIDNYDDSQESQTSQESQEEDTTDVPTTSKKSEDEEQLRTLFHAAMMLQSQIKDCTNFYETWPPAPSEFTVNNAAKMVPSSLALFLSWLLGFSTVPTMDEHLKLKEKDYLKVISIAQDIIYVSSNGRKHTPKSFSLGMAVRQITGSYQLTKILNGFGHSVSHPTIRSFDTALAVQAKSSTVVIPEGIMQSKFTMMVWDNIDFLEETPTGAGTTHMANGIIIQQTNDNEEPTVIRPRPKPSKKSVRSLKTPEEPLQAFILGKRESPKLLQFLQDDEINTSLVAHKPILNRSLMLDFIYVICKFFCDELSVLLPGWTGFNTMINEKPASISKIGYLPVVDAPVTDFATIFTILRRSLDIANQLQLQYAVLIFDEAVYAKVQQVRWKYEEFQSKFIVRMGEFHACMSYATAIACRFRDAGLQDIFIESEIVAQGSLNGVFSGKHYNRCIRAHKLVFEAMERLRFEAFLDSQTTLQKGEIIGLVKEMNGNLNKEHLDAYVENVAIHEIQER